MHLDTYGIKQDGSLPWCSSRRGGHNGPKSISLRKEKEARLIPPLQCIGEGGGDVVLELLGKLCSVGEEECLRLHPGFPGPGGLSVCGPLVICPGNFGRNGSTRFQRYSGDPDLLVGSGL